MTRQPRQGLDVLPAPTGHADRGTADRAEGTGGHGDSVFWLSHSSIHSNAFFEAGLFCGVSPLPDHYRKPEDGKGDHCIHVASRFCS